MSRRHSSHPWRLVNLALLASAASARTISLSSFELISSIFITPACLDAYNTPLEGCELQDFLLGRKCSQACIAGLQTIEATIQQACNTANPRPGTLLSRTKAGELVVAVCGAPPANDAEDEDGGNQVTTVTTTTTTRLASGLPPSGMTTVTKAITPKPAPTLTTTTISGNPPPATTQDSTTSVVEQTSANPIDPPRSSVSSSSKGEETTQPGPTLLPPVRPTSTTSQAARSTAARDDDNNSFSDSRPPGSGGGGLEDVGLPASAMMSRPSLFGTLAAITCAVLMVAL
ncbi:hypothetical protein NLU13_4571 [Sarocladium strictum]|uniref:Uncharacterized protein n=1 Tax=Sarocladium strictum TaxID=5046 RepID=A0AA39GJG1_SARSR|nr:hypothetical protein NLU13_4571 [Sarocladium strictum]